MSKTKLFLLIAICSMITCIYYASLGCGTYFDDLDLSMRLYDQPIFVQLKNVFFGDSWRGVAIFTINFIAKFFGEQNFVAQRIFNIFLHLTNFILLFYLLQRFFRDFAISIFCSAIFVLNPITIYAVHYIYQRSILLVVFFALLQMIFLGVAIASQKKRVSISFFVFALASYLLACMCKEQAVPLVVIFWALPILLSKNENVRNTLLFMAPCFVLTAFFVAAKKYKHLFGQVDGYYGQHVINACGVEVPLHLKSAMTQARMFFEYFIYWLLPFLNKSMDLRKQIADSAFSPIYFASALWYVIASLSSLYLLFKRHLSGFALFVIISLFIVEFQVERFGEIFVLYRAYLFSIFYALIVASLMFQFKNKFQFRFFHLSGLAIILIHTYFSFREIQFFKSPLYLWKRAAEVADTTNINARCQTVRAYSNYGDQLIRAGYPDAAIEPEVGPLIKAVKISPTFCASIINKAAAEMMLGQFEQARVDYEFALSSSDEKIVISHARAGIETLDKIQMGTDIYQNEN